MFTESKNCVLNSFGYNSKHNSLYLILTNRHLAKEFQTGFINVAAYSYHKHSIGQRVVEITKTAPEKLLVEHWDKIVQATDNIWPNSQSRNLTEAISDTSTYKLNGYIVEFSGNNIWWVISQNYLFLGKAPNKA
jgi:hypothetical protein